MSSHVQPVRVRTAGRGRPALATGVFLLVASLALSVSPVPPDARSISPTSRSFINVLVQGDGAAAATAVTDADRTLQVRAADPVPGGVDPVPGSAHLVPGGDGQPDATPRPIRPASPSPGGLAAGGRGDALAGLDLHRAAAAGPGRDAGEDTQPPRTPARRLGDPLCRCS